MAKIRTAFPFRVEVIENLTIPMSDGIQLAARVWMPQGSGAVPALLEYLPYRKRDGTRSRDNGFHEYFAGHGYVSIRLDIRGTGDSEDVISDEYTVREQLDGCDAIDWIAQQDWCNGKVAMFGISWGGFNALQIAARQPPALKTIITVGSTDDRYATDVHYVGGCLSKDNFDWAATMDSMIVMPPDPETSGPDWRDMWQARLDIFRPWIFNWLNHQRRNDYWKQGSICENFSAIRIPVYAVSGWADNYSESVPRLLAGLKCPRKGLIGPWAHSYPHDAAVEPAIGWLQEALRWFDHWLKDRDTGVMKEPMYRVWMQESVPPKTCYVTRPGRWVAERTWPSPRIKKRKYRLSANGSLGGTMTGKLSICSPLWVGNAAGEVGRYGEEAEWPTDQREDDGGSLVFVTAPLKSKTEILGAPQLHLTFTADKPKALVCVRVNDVAPDGSSTRVTIGLMNLAHASDHENAAALRPGKKYSTTVELDDIAHTFPKGHRIAVSISTAYWPIAWPSPELASITIECGKSFLTLPVRPPNPADRRLHDFAEPEQAPPPQMISHPVAPKVKRSIRRGLLLGEIEIDFPRWTYSYEFPDIDVIHSSEAMARYTIVDGDPLSAKVETETKAVLQRKDATITQHARGTLTCDMTHFFVTVEMKVAENGTPLLDRTWHEKIRRDMV